MSRNYLLLDVARGEVLGWYSTLETLKKAIDEGDYVVPCDDMLVVKVEKTFQVRTETIVNIYAEEDKGVK